MAQTPRGFPFPVPGDAPDGAGQLRALAEAIDDLIHPDGSRSLAATGLSVPNNTAFPVTGGYVATGADDDGNGLLNYSAGILTAARGMVVDVLAYTAWPAGTVGDRRTDVTIAGQTFRVSTPAPNTSGNIGQAVTVPGVRLNAGQTAQCTLFQNSGAAITPFRHEFRITIRRVDPA